MAGEWSRTDFPSIYVQTLLRDGKTSKRYKVSYRDRSGKVTSKTLPSLNEAKRYKRGLENARDEGLLPDLTLSRKTMEELWDHFGASWDKKPSTLARYGWAWQGQIAPVFGSRRIGSIQKSELVKFFSDVEETKSRDARRKTQMLVHKLFAFAMHEDWLQRNPADNISAPVPERKEARFLTEEELKRVAEAMPERYGALVWTLGVTGLRIGEALALRVKNVDGNIRVVENSVEFSFPSEMPTQSSSGTVVGTPKSRSSRRVVPIPPGLLQMLKDHMTTYSNVFDPETLVFTASNGARIRQSNFRHQFQAACLRVGIEPTPKVHDLRHTAASLMLKIGLQPFEVAKLLGHSNSGLVESLYGHLYESHLQAKVDLMGDVLG